MTDIKPRMFDGVGWCDCLCVANRDDFDERYDDISVEVMCPFDNLWRDVAPYPQGWIDNGYRGEICPVWARRMAAWDEEARDDLSSTLSAADLLDGVFIAYQGARYSAIKKTLSRYPGKPTSRQEEDGE